MKWKNTVLVVLCACVMSLAMVLAGCGGSLNTEEVTAGDCSVKFTGYRWDEGKDWGKKSGYMVFVLSGTLTNNGSSPVRPADHLVALATFEGSDHGHVNELRVNMPSGNEEVAPGESAEVLLYDAVDAGVKKSYYDGSEATVEWGWVDDMSEVESQKTYQVLDDLGEKTHTIALGKI